MTTETLSHLGWRKHFVTQITEDESGLLPARVSRQDVNQYHLLSANGPLTGILPGRARQTASKADLPGVGDWVLCAPADAADPSSVVIERTLARFSKFSRKEAGERFDEQVVAANIDTVFIVTGLDDNFNPSRIERYLLLAWNSGANPVIVLSKSDLREQVDECIEALGAIAMDAPIFVVSAINDEGLAPLKGYLYEGQTVALLGSSGVGKSTIINALLGYDRFDTGDVREGDSKGRHTTTFRELVPVESGGLLIDTPGMREIQLWADESALTVSFSDIEDYARKCKFNNCTHADEPGCAVQVAISSGELEADRLESFRKLQREIRHFEEKQDAALRAEGRVERRKFAKMIRNRPNKRD